MDELGALEVEKEARLKLGNYKHDPRERDAFALYRFINENICDRCLPSDPATVVKVCVNEDMCDYGLTDRHPRKFVCIAISGFHCKTYQELYGALVHEIIHVITAQKDGTKWKHQRPYQRHGTVMIKKLNSLSDMLPAPFTGLVLNPKLTLKKKGMYECK